MTLSNSYLGQKGGRLLRGDMSGGLEVSDCKDIFLLKNLQALKKMSQISFRLAAHMIAALLLIIEI